MKILMLTNRVPFPLHDGGNIAVNQLIQGYLKAQVQLDILSMNTTRHFVHQSQYKKHFDKVRQFITVDVNNDIKAIDAFKNLFSTESYNLSRFISQNFQSKLIELLNNEDYDVIQLEGLYVTPYLNTIKQNSKALVVYRQHNIEYLIWDNMAENEGCVLKKWYLKLLTARLKKYEDRLLKDLDFLLPISKTDLNYVLTINPNINYHIAPFGIEDISNKKQEFNTEKNCFHIGAMDWLPNQEGIKWFLRDIWPKVILKVPDAYFYFGGRDTDLNDYLPLPQNVICEGEVNNLYQFEQNKQILVVPLKSASGLRIKIIEGLSKGKTILATKTAISGIQLTENKEVLIADTATEFSDKLIDLLLTPDLSFSVSNNGHQFALKHFDNQKIVNGILNFFYRSLESLILNSHKYEKT